MRLPLAERMTDKAFKGMVPLYVRGPEGTDHKCGGCSMRVELDGDRSYCTIVLGEISQAHGVCNYWAAGKASAREDIHDARLEKESAGYVEFRGAVNCSSCKFIGGSGGEPEMRRCKLWMANVALGDCCISWEEKSSPWRGSRPISEKWSRALNEDVGFAVTDRYDALGIPTPNPATMCRGQCEGTGYVPICEDDPEEPWRTLWLQAEAENPTDDGWHFVTCPTCEGTRMANPHEKAVAEAAEIAEGDTPAVRVAKQRLATLLRR